MTVIEVSPLFLKDVELTIGGSTGSDFRKHVDSVTFTPTTATATWTGLGGNSHTNQSTATWTVTLNYAQDWTTGSLSEYLFNNEGQTVEMTFRPTSGVGPSFMADVVIAPGAIGGAVNAYVTASVTLGVDGKPELIPAA